jgi:predicted DNA-binding transcriptional regulator AlpA
MPPTKSTRLNNPPVAVFASVAQVRARYGGVSHMWIERHLQDDPDFPKPIYIGRLRFFKISDLEYYEKLCAKRPAPPSHLRRQKSAA